MKTNNQNGAQHPTLQFLTTKTNKMSNGTETPNYWKLASDKFSEITNLIYSDNIDKVALADLIIEYGSLKYRDGHKDGTR